MDLLSTVLGKSSSGIGVESTVTTTRTVKKKSSGDITDQTKISTNSPSSPSISGSSSVSTAATSTTTLTTTTPTSPTMDGSDGETPRKVSAIANGSGSGGEKRQVSFRDELDGSQSFKVPLKDDGGSYRSPSERSSSYSSKSPRSRFSSKNNHKAYSINASERSNTSLESIQSGDSKGSKESIASALSRESTGGVSLPSLGKTLMRTKKHRDPLRYYEVLKVLGDGSMGSVSKVKKRAHAVGGSARKDFVDSEQRDNSQDKCFSFGSENEGEDSGFGFPCFTLFCFPGSKSNRSDSNNSLIVVDDNGNKNSNSSGGAASAVSGITVDSNGSNGNGTDSAKKRPLSKDERINSYKGSTSRHSSMIDYETETTVVYALKSIILDRVSDSVFKKELLNEIDILKTLDHPNIVKAVETYDYKNRMYLVLELCSGGDLYARDPYDENQAKAIIRSLLDAIAYLHSKNITHRDLKYENIMFASPTTNTVKIIDFGLSKKYGNSAELMHETVGTVYTMAPEVIKGDYDQQCDVWSIGIIAFMLLSSSLPFYGKTRAHVVRRILQGKYAFKGRRWKEISPEAKAFIESLLVHDPAARPTAGDALEHEWLKEDFAIDGTQVSTAIMDQVQACIQTFASYSRMRKLALLVISYRSTDEEVGFLRRLFQQRFDKVKDGVINYPEFKEALKVYSYTEEELVAMFTGVDIDGTGTVSYSEFLAATIETHGPIEESRIAEAFDRIDGDDTGYITVKNLKFMLGQEVSEDYIDEVIDEVDLTRDHRICYDEFLSLWDDDSEEKLRQALTEVKKRRLERESVGDFDSQSTTSSSFSDDDTEFSIEEDEYAIARPGVANVFFDKQREKSVRAVWI
mmetsp:Transcript_34563/g.83468  ORF Transcript_34563/g.83468 Transcript_34563/m.83468 type:complete len:858 (-) Transcript_34563:103-2676(-)